MAKKPPMGGYIKLPRDFFEFRYSPSSLHVPYTDCEAFLDLNLMANHADRFCGDVLVKRGQFYRTNQTLARRWNWSESKVKRFKKKLRLAGEIEYDTSSRKITPITLTRYNEIQGEVTDDSGPIPTNPSVHLPDEK